MDIKGFTDLAQQNWHKPTGLIFTIVASILFEILLLNNLSASCNTAITVYSITVIACIIAWFYSNRIPKAGKGKIGIVVSVQCSDKEQNKLIKEDFINTLRKLIKSGSLGQSFDFIEIPNHISESIKDIEDAYALKAKTKSQFLIFGRVRLRRLGGKECHIIELDGIVAHKPLDKETSNRLSKEFHELFPRRINISKENDLLSFNFTSDWTESVAKYIIAIASALSGDLNYAERLYIDVQKKIKHLNSNFPIFSKLQDRIPIRLFEIHIARSKFFLGEWRKTNGQKELSEFSINLNKISDNFNNDYTVLLLRGVEAFLNGRKINDAFNYLKKCKNYDDPLWHFNLAFLWGYTGDLASSIREYRKASNYESTPQALVEIEEFIVWILEEEPEKYQFYYCLGFFNWKIKGDLNQAAKDFEEFLNRIKEGEFLKEKRLTEKWISEIVNQT